MSSNNFKRPNPLPLLTCWRTNLYTIPLFILATGFFGSCALFVSLFEKSGRIQHRIAQFWAWWLVRFSGAKLTIEGTENLKLPTNAVYISNHTSPPLDGTTPPTRSERSEPARGPASAPSRFPHVSLENANSCPGNCLVDPVMIHEDGRP